MEAFIGWLKSAVFMCSVHEVIRGFVLGADKIKTIRKSLARFACIKCIYSSETINLMRKRARHLLPVIM